jgi:hypothetical protein
MIPFVCWYTSCMLDFLLQVCCINVLEKIDCREIYPTTVWASKSWKKPKKKHFKLIILLLYHTLTFAYWLDERLWCLPCQSWWISQVDPVSSLEGFGLENDKIEAERNWGYGSENGRRAHASVAFVTCEAMKPLQSHFVYWKQREADLCEYSIFFITYLVCHLPVSFIWKFTNQIGFNF